MIDLSQRCIFSGGSENLNTIMEVTLDGEKYKVAISDEHEDDASPGAIKKLIPERIAAKEAARAELLSKLDDFKALAAELGFDLVKKGENPSSAVPAQNRPSGDPNALSDKPTVQVGNSTFKQQKNTRTTQRQVDQAGLSPEEAAAALEAVKRGAKHQQNGPSPSSGQAASFTKHRIPEQIKVQTSQGVKVYEKPLKGTQTMQTVKGAAGIPTAIPRHIQGTDGETTITVVNTGGNKTIQMRGRQLAQMREQGQGSFYSQQCRPCQGTGLHARRQCKACGGSGIVI